MAVEVVEMNVVDVTPSPPAEVLETPNGCQCCTKLKTKVHQFGNDLSEFGGEVADLGRQLHLKRRLRSLCTVDSWKETFPISKWLPKYR